MASAYWWENNLVAIVAHGTEADGVWPGDVLLLDPETLEIRAVVTYRED